MKVHLKLSPPSSREVTRMIFVVSALALLAVVGESEWTSRQAFTEQKSRSQEIWRNYTLLAAAEADYQTTQWTSEAHLAESEANLRRYLQAFPQLRSREEYNEWKRLSLVLARRFAVAREAQSSFGDHQFNAQMKNFRAAIDRTDSFEQQRAAALATQARGLLWFRIFLVALITALVLLLRAWWSAYRSSKRRRRRRGAPLPTTKMPAN